MNKSGCPRTLLVLAHPDPGSFCHALCQALVSDLQARKSPVTFMDLYREGFDPVMDLDELRRKASLDDLVIRSQKALAEAEAVVLVGPEWWGSHPALMKGWIERCLRPGVAYWHEDGGASTGHGMLSHQSWLLCMSSDGESAGPVTAHFPSPAGSVHARDALRFPGLDGLARSLASACGMREISCLVFSPVRQSGYRQRQDWIALMPRLLSNPTDPETALPEGTWLWKQVNDGTLETTSLQEEKK